MSGLTGNKPLLGGWGPACSEAPKPAAYGEQGADTDGLANLYAEALQLSALTARSNAAREAYKAEQMLEQAQRRAIDCGEIAINANAELAEARLRIARKEEANIVLTNRVMALEAKLMATLADAQSLQRSAADWEAECRRLSALMVEMQEKLAQRMALPANALRFGGIR